MGNYLHDIFYLFWFNLNSHTRVPRPSRTVAARVIRSRDREPPPHPPSRYALPPATPLATHPTPSSITEPHAGIGTRASPELLVVCRVVTGYQNLILLLFVVVTCGAHRQVTWHHHLITCEPGVTDAMTFCQ